MAELCVVVGVVLGEGITKEALESAVSVCVVLVQEDVSGMRGEGAEKERNSCTSSGIFIEAQLPVQQINTFSTPSACSLLICIRKIICE